MISPPKEPLDEKQPDETFSPPKAVKKRVPDTVHLQRLRAMLVASNSTTEANEQKI